MPSASHAATSPPPYTLLLPHLYLHLLPHRHLHLLPHRHLHLRLRPDSPVASAPSAGETAGPPRALFRDAPAGSDAGPNPRLPLAGVPTPISGSV